MGRERGWITGRAPLFLTLSLALSACEETPAPVTAPQPTPPSASATTTAKAPEDPAPVTDGDVTVAWANGVKILVKRIPGAELAAIQLYIVGGARDFTAEDAGITRLSLAVAAHGGTTTLAKDPFHRKLESLGSDLWSESGADFAAMKAKTPLTAWDETFALLGEAFLRPALPAFELDVWKQRQLAAIAAEQDSPDGALDLLVNKAVFKNHPFSNRPIGTEASVSGLTLDAVKAHLAKLRESGRLVLVTAGDLDPSHVVEKAKAMFGDLPRGSFEKKPFPELSHDKATVAITERKLSTNYIQGSFAAPGWTSPDHPVGIVTMSLLRNRLFEEIRTKRNLSYAPGAGVAGGSTVPFGFLYVTTVDPSATIKVMYDEVRKLQSEPVSEKEVSSTKSVYLTTYLMQNEATDGQAGMLASAELLGGDWKLARTLPERIRAVTPAAVQAYAKKYLGRLQVVALGDPAKLDASLLGSL